MATGGTTHMNLSLGHVRADPVHARQVALELEPGVAWVSAHLEELGERHLPISVKNLEALDLRDRQVQTADGVRPSTSTGIDVSAL